MTYSNRNYQSPRGKKLQLQQLAIHTRRGVVKGRVVLLRVMDTQATALNNINNWHSATTNGQVNKDVNLHAISGNLWCTSVNLGCTTGTYTSSNTYPESLKNW